jgi:hypothetical protein
MDEKVKMNTKDHPNLKAALEWRHFLGRKCQWQGQREKQEERGGKNKVHLVKGKKGG